MESVVGSPEENASAKKILDHYRQTNPNASPSNIADMALRMYSSEKVVKNLSKNISNAKSFLNRTKRNTSALSKSLGGVAHARNRILLDLIPNHIFYNKLLESKSEIEKNCGVFLEIIHKINDDIIVQIFVKLQTASGRAEVRFLKEIPSLTELEKAILDLAGRIASNIVINIRIEMATLLALADNDPNNRILNFGTRRLFDPEPYLMVSHLTIHGSTSNNLLRLPGRIHVQTQFGKKIYIRYLPYFNSFGLSFYQLDLSQMGIYPIPVPLAGRCVGDYITNNLFFGYPFVDQLKPFTTIVSKIKSLSVDKRRNLKRYLDMYQRNSDFLKPLVEGGRRYTRKRKN